ncbi:MAG: pseudouridine synthase [Candidatus Woesearchaeota archaeon]
MDRVQKIIANAGYCSRRKAEKLISEGRVVVDGVVASLGDTASSSSKIVIDGKSLVVDDLLTVAYYKPVGVQTSLSDKRTETLEPVLEEIGQRLIPAGRLDMDAEGLLILTNDGDLANHIMHPRYEKHKTYLAFLDCAVTQKHIDELLAGVSLRDGAVTVHEAELAGPKSVRLSIHEGRNKLVKRLLRKVTNGFVQKLVRERVGDVSIADLSAGQWRELSSQEIASLRK